MFNPSRRSQRDSNSQPSPRQGAALAVELCNLGGSFLATSLARGPSLGPPVAVHTTNFSGTCWIRTSDLLLAKQLLSQTELKPLSFRRRNHPYYLTSLLTEGFTQKPNSLAFYYFLTCVTIIVHGGPGWARTSDSRFMRAVL